jgi:DNA polymerase-3 subunit delta
MPGSALKPVYAVVGEDSFLQLQRLAEILAAAPKDVQRVDVDGERAELAEVLDELRSFAMFGGSKLVVVRNGDELITRFREQLEDYAAAPSSGSTLVLRLNKLPKTQRIYKAIVKVGSVEPCDPPAERDLPKWIMAHAKSAHKVTLSFDAARMLAERIGADLGRLDNEIAKLALVCPGKSIDVDSVNQCVVFQREQEMWEMTNALAGGEVAEALRRWRQLVDLDPSTEFRAVTWLGMWLEDLRAAQAGRANAVAWKYRDRLPLLIKTAQSLGTTGVSRAVDLLADVDRRSKSGLGEAKENVERFILSFAT